MNTQIKKIKTRGGPLNQYTAVIKRVKGDWIGWIEEVPGINCQEKTQSELISSLKTTLQEILSINRQDAISNAGSNFQEIKIAA